MKTIKFALAGALLTFAIGACGGDADEWKGKYSKLIDEVCACKDSDCVDKVSEKRRALRKEFKEKVPKDKQKEIGKQMGDLDEKWGECRKKAEGGGEAKTE